MAPNDTNHCSSWVVVDLIPNSGEAYECGEFRLDQLNAVPQLQPNTSVERLLCLSPGSCDYLNQLFFDPGVETTIDGLFSNQNDSQYTASQQLGGTPKQRLKQALNKYTKNVTSRKSHHIVAQLWFPVAVEDDLILRKSGRYAFGPFVNNDPIKMVYKRYDLEFSRKAFPIGSKSVGYLGVAHDKDLPRLSEFDVGSILVNRSVADKAFLLQCIQWAPNVHIYSNNSQHYHICETLALPVFDYATSQCVGVFELVIDCPYNDYATEIQEICQHLQEECLGADAMLVNQPRQMVLLEIMNLLRNVSQIHDLPLAQTWLPCHCCGGDQNSLCMRSAEIPFILMDASLYKFWKAGSMYHMCEGQGVAGRAFQSKGSCFCNDITQFSDDNFPLVHKSRKFRVYSSLAICLRSTNTGDEIYIVQFFFRSRFISMKEQKSEVDSIVKSIEKNSTSLQLASFEIEEIDAKLGNITKLEWLSNIYPVKEQNNFRTPSETCGVGHLSEDMVDKGKGPMVELDANKDIGYKKVRKKKTQNVVSCKEDLKPFLKSTKEVAAKALGVSMSTIKRLPQQFGFRNWSEARKSFCLPPAKRTRKTNKCDEPTSSSDRRG